MALTSRLSRTRGHRPPSSVNSPCAKSAEGASGASSVMVMSARFMGCPRLVMCQAFIFLTIDRPGGLVDNASIPSNPMQSP